MPVSVSYPGVYVQEINNATPTISGVATSITAFVGRTYWGPVNQPTTIFSFGDFQRYFGGLVNGFPLGFAVNDFFQNGGAQAIIVRIYGPYWLDFPLNPTQQALASAAAQAVDAMVGALTPGTGATYVTAAQVSQTASNAAAQYFQGVNPEQWTAANGLALLAGDWFQALGTASLPNLTSTLTGVAAQLNSGAKAVVDAMKSAPVLVSAEDALAAAGVAAATDLAAATIAEATLADAEAAGDSAATISADEAIVTDEAVTTSAQDTFDADDAAFATAAVDVTALLDVAQATAATQIPGATQQGAQLVVDQALAAYDAAGATVGTVLTAAQTALTDIAAAITDLSGAATTAAGDTGADVESVLNALAQFSAFTNASSPVNPFVALAIVNPLIAQVMPTPAYALANTLAAPTVIAQQMVSDNVGPASAAAVPSTTATVTVQAPQGFVAVAGAANLIAQTAWLATTEPSASPTTVVQAAQEAAAAYKAANPGSSASAAVGAAQAVANAAQAQIVAATPALTAAAAASAVSGAVQTALGLTSTNSAITSLAAAEIVANAAWQAIGSGSTTVEAAATAAAATAGTDLISAAAAKQVATLAATGSGQAAALNVSTGLVAIVAGALPPLILYAANAGDWANGDLTVTLNTTGITANAVAAMNLTPAPGNPPFTVGDLFNLAVVYTAPNGSTLSETWNAVSLRFDAGVQRIDLVLANSVLIQYIWPGWTPGSSYPTAPQPVPVPGAYGVAGVPTVPVATPFGLLPAGGTVASAATTAAAAAAAAAALLGTPSAPLQIEDYLQDQSTNTGIYALNLVTQFDLLCIPPDTQVTTLPPAIPGVDTDDTWRIELYNTAAVLCQSNYAMLILDPLSQWALDTQAGNTAEISIDDLGTYGPEGEYAAVYFPLLVEGNPLLNGQLGYFAPSGAIAGIMARTDTNRGVWKAPAGVNDGAISGTMALEVNLSDTDSGLLNPQGINCLRTFPIYGNVVWGARTLKGADVLSNPYKYIPVRRLALFIEASLLRGLQWAVFEPNADPLWSAIRLSVGAFMNTLFRQGAFAGSTASTAYFVACDSTTTTPTDIAQGIVNVTVGFAPLLPAEFVVISIQQIAGQTPT